MKKPSVVSFLITLLLAAAVCTHGREYVTDKDGNGVKVGGQYLIQPVKTENNNGRGLIPFPVDTSPICPLGIAQTYLPNEPGSPVIFRYPHGGVEPYVPISYPVTIEFTSNNGCADYSKLWTVNDSSSAIFVGGTPEEKSSWFRIEKAGEAAENTYKLTTLYGTVGTIPDGLLALPRLFVTNDNSKTLLVKFSKVDDATTATSYFYLSG